MNPRARSAPLAVIVAVCVSGCAGGAEAPMPRPSGFVRTDACPSLTEVENATKVGINGADRSNSRGGCTYYAYGPGGTSDVRAGVLILDLSLGSAETTLAEERARMAASKAVDTPGLGSGAFQIEFLSRPGSQSTCTLYFASGTRVFSLRFVSNVTQRRDDCQVTKSLALALLS